MKKPYREIEVHEVHAIELLEPAGGLEVTRFSPFVPGDIISGPDGERLRVVKVPTAAGMDAGECIEVELAD